MRVLVTGASGFIGASVTRALVARGAEVHALVRSRAAATRLGDVASKLVVHEADLTDVAATARVVAAARPELCIHLAWYAVPGKYLDAAENLACVSASLHLAERLRDVGCQRLVGAGTCFEYDTSLGYLAESSATAPRFLYSACKLSLFTALRAFAPLANMTFAWTRFFYQYGPSEPDARLVPQVIDRLLGGGTADVTAGAQVRDFLHVEDVAAAVVATALSSLEGAVNIGSGVPVTVRALVETIARLCDATGRVRFGAIPYRPNDPMFVCANVDKLRTTGFTPRFDLETGLRDAIRSRQPGHGQERENEE